MKAIVIGGGAAGLFAAGFLAKGGVETTVIEHSTDTARKVLITGKGRCNVTNNCDEETFLKNVRTNPKFLYSSIYGFPPVKTMEFFENMGVPLKTERGRRVFPVSDSSMDIKKALDRHAKGAKLIYDDVQELIFDQDSVKGVVLKSGRKLYADKVIVATGGLSYKQTGSTGDGYRFAESAGHKVVTPTASLVPLVENGTKCRQMMGLSLKNVNLTIMHGKKKLFTEQGEMLFTHFGISGPLVLSASCHIKDKDIQQCTAVIDMKPALTEEVLYKRVCTDFEKLHSKKAANCLDLLLPKSMIEVMLKEWGIDTEKTTNQITKEERMKLVKLMKGFTIPLNSKFKIDIAVITSGGVATKELNPATMQSKIKNGLYFIGEVIDTDAYTGGYNLQIAFSTAYACAQSIIEEM
ncbi:MAG: aminoacetone oxidase family FAD-binding enzyme [Oscillospiraceae bacterium]|nr:aminoacetone oxidase family FAD-binding enzyme [Oscillospiraceae bacterium]